MTRIRCQPKLRRLLSGVEMLTPKESARLFDMNHRLRNLHTQQAQALRGGDAQRVDELQAEIDELTTDCDKVLDACDVS